ncbi:unnamed protein product [Ambrosiozyma monospora]|uniref:Unnamed protein product n=1 Tax=Ambrosiozyma monospora TaxID=43982 RepID=A0ACB5T2Y9_AMBMO|nr:unnamed protein product [Ambrosiozyma monospora]
MSIRLSDFEPKVYDSKHPEASFIHHYSLWRVFLDMTPKLFKQLHIELASAQSSVQPSVQPTVHPSLQTVIQTPIQPSDRLNEDNRRSSPHEDFQTTNSTTEDSAIAPGGQEEGIESAGQEISIPLPRAAEQTSSLDAELKLPGDYFSSATNASKKRSLKRNKDQKEKLWEQSDFKDREKDYPGCTITIADFDKTRYRFERRIIYTEDAHGNFPKIRDCDPDETPKQVFLEKLKKSKEGLVKALRNKPGWSKLRWVNVNGIEKSTLFSIMDVFNLDSKATSYMFNAGENFNVDTYENDQLFCELCVLHGVKNESDDNQTGNLEPSHEETTVEKLHRLFPNVTTYLSEKSKLRKFEPDEDNCAFMDDKDTHDLAIQDGVRRSD